MAIYGVGAFYDGDSDMSADFINHKVIGTGWDANDAPELHQYFISMKVGDLVYIKAAFGGSKDIKVKGIGIVRDSLIVTSHPVEIGRNVVWLSTKRFSIPKPAREKNNVRSNTVYEEFHPEVQVALMAAIQTTIV